LEVFDAHNDPSTQVSQIEFENFIGSL
jgi:hypothetical protein